MGELTLETVVNLHSGIRVVGGVDGTPGALHAVTGTNLKLAVGGQ